MNWEKFMESTIESINFQKKGIRLIELNVEVLLVVFK